jgi:hypothetical protein
LDLKRDTSLLQEARQPALQNKSKTKINFVKNLLDLGRYSQSVFVAKIAMSITLYLQKLPLR